MRVKAASRSTISALTTQNEDPTLQGLKTRLDQVSFTQLLSVLEATADCADRSLAIELYQAWIIANPEAGSQLVIAWFNLGVEAARTGDHESASRAYLKALALKPDFHPAALNLGFMHERNGAPETALAVWTQAIQSDEARSTLLNQRARLCEQLGRLGDAEQALCSSLATNPTQSDVIHHLVHLRQRMCRWPVLAPDVLRVPQPELLADCGPLAGLSLTDRVAAQTAITARWLARRTTAVPIRLSPAGGYRHEKVRLGYMSSDFGRHAMSYLIAELFERHDRARFSIHGYGLVGDDGSDIRARIVQAFDHFTLLSDLTDEQAARTIAADEIDILVDLNGLTRGSRPQVLRWRPAPIQATYLGFVGPLPLPELDYLLCDDYVVPPQTAPLYRPAPLYVGQIYQANDTRREIGPPTCRADNGLPEHTFVFCCFSNHYKVTPELFAAWMAILSRVPNSVLWLAVDNQWSRESLLAEAERRGVSPARLIFAERVGPASYIRRLAVADLFLDTFPYNAGTIASDAIRMSLPLLTLVGESFASRMAARLLTAIGATGGIAETLPGYIETAVLLATQPTMYSAYKALFSEKVWRETIGDMARFTAGFQTAMLEVQTKLEPAQAA